MAINREAAKAIIQKTGGKGYRPILCFIDETREYLLGKLRKGETLSGEEVAKFINKIKA